MIGITSSHYKFGTLLGLSKTLSTIGQIIIAVGGLFAVLGLFSFIGGDSFTKPMGLLGLLSGLIMVGLGYIIIAYGQVIECFISIEENTHKTSEILEALQQKFPNLNS
ncbi:MAG: hypothetical protein AB1432_06250 [Bacteroidota bacterium]